MDKKNPENGLSASQLITSKIAELPDWRGNLIAHVRELIHEVAPAITEEWKWGTAVWSQKGNVLAVASFKDHIKINFFKGASLEDPHGLFNAGLEAKATRAIDIRESDDIPESALRELIRAAAAFNLTSGKQK